MTGEYGPETPIHIWQDGWKLYHRETRDSGVWRNLVLRAPWKAVRGRGKGHPKDKLKEVFWLGWNGRRFADRSDYQILCNHHPEIEKRTEQFLKLYFGEDDDE